MNSSSLDKQVVNLNAAHLRGWFPLAITLTTDYFSQKISNKASCQVSLNGDTLNINRLKVVYALEFFQCIKYIM